MRLVRSLLTVGGSNAHLGQGLLRRVGTFLGHTCYGRVGYGPFHRYSFLAACQEASSLTENGCPQRREPRQAMARLASRFLSYSAPHVGHTLMRRRACAGIRVGCYTVPPQTGHLDEVPLGFVYTVAWLTCSRPNTRTRGARCRISWAESARPPPSPALSASISSRLCRSSRRAIRRR